MEDTFAVRLAVPERNALTFQRYGPQPDIDGVSFCPLRKHLELSGWFMEHLRVTDGRIDTLSAAFELRQISFSRAMPGRINAFHIHPKRPQDELWCVVQGCLMVWLVDCREESPTLGIKCRHILQSEQPGLLYIPSGVAHGYRAGPDGALLVYATTCQFDPADPNEGRLRWDHFGASLWDDDRG